MLFSVLVPAPRQLTLERQLNKSVVIGWSAPEAPAGTVDCYHVYVDGLLRTSVRVSDRTCALIEGVDSNRVRRGGGRRRWAGEGFLVRCDDVALHDENR